MLSETELLAMSLDDLEAWAEEHALGGKTIVIPAHWATRSVAHETRIVRIGTVPLRWGSSRLLLVSKEQAEVLANGEELFRPWVLWRYKFDPFADGFMLATASVTRILLSNLANGRHWKAHLRGVA